MDNGVWGRNVNSFDYVDFIREIDYVKNNYKTFSPRQSFIDFGLDKDNCRNRWISLINEL